MKITMRTTAAMAGLAAVLAAGLAAAPEAAASPGGAGFGRAGSAQATQLYGVSCTSPAACTTVGEAIYPKRIAPVTERWNGRTWVI